MENKFDINADADYAFFEELRERIIGAEDESGAEKPAPPAPHAGMEEILALAEQMRSLYLTHDAPEDKPRVPEGWRPLYAGLKKAITKVYGRGVLGELDGGLGVMDLGPAHFTAR